MVPFDGAKCWWTMMLVLLGAALLTTPYVGLTLFVPVGFGGYWLLKYCNLLEARDLRDIENERRRNRRNHRRD